MGAVHEGRNSSPDCTHDSNFPGSGHLPSIRGQARIAALRGASRYETQAPILPCWRTSGA